jgi:hypothetical protein
VSQEIEFKILPDGTVDINMIGYKGNACDIDMKKIIRQLGESVKSKKKQEYYDSSKVKITQKE